jgi:hypothetical protein
MVTEGIDRRRFLKYAGAGAGLLAAGAAGYYLHDELDRPRTGATTSTTATGSETGTPDTTPPVIQDLRWQPTRVINGKVYDANISFIAWDMDSYVESITVDFVAAQYSHLPKEAFPKEDARTFTGKLGSKVARFDQEVRDIKGGREYEVRVTSKDARDNVAIATLTTPYVREFESISDGDDVLVLADYYTWYERISNPGSHWYDDEGRRMHPLDPVLGQYASGEDAVISKHIDWATGHGIDAFSVSWWSTARDERTWDYHTTENLEILLKDPLIDNIRFAILYENNGRLRISNPNDPSPRWIEDLNDPFNRNRLVSDFEFLAECYFSHPSYLRIKDMPVVRFDYTIPFRGDIAGVFDEVRAALETKSFEVYLINDLMGRSASPYESNEYGVGEKHFRLITEAFDAVGASNFPGAYDDIEKDARYIENVYKAWRNYAKEHGKDFIPGVWPGHQQLMRSPQRLRRQINLAKQYSTVETFSVISFNEWGAGHQIEPSKEEGLVYLETIRDSI